MPKSHEPRTPRKIKLITPSFLKTWSLPKIDDNGDKESRGRVLVVAGSKGMPGAATLAATASLRVGAGKLKIAVPDCISQSVATSVPESLVLSLNEKKPGTPKANSAQIIIEKLSRLDSVLIGCGMDDSDLGKKNLHRMVVDILAAATDCVITLDACAMEALKNTSEQRRNKNLEIIITPHAGEMASLTGKEKDVILADPVTSALEFAKEKQVVVVLKGAETIIATPGGDIFQNTKGNAGLGTSGSGDVLAGLIAGLAARGANAAQAAVWGVYLHAVSGDRLAKEIGPVGYLAREILDVVPMEMAKLSR